MAIRPEPEDDLAGLREPRDNHLDKSRSDSSRYVRNWIRAGWSIGQQLWDSMLNDNFAWANLWNHRFTHFRRNLRPNQRPPWYVPGGHWQVNDPKHIQPWYDGEEWAGKRNSIVSIGPGGPAFYRSFNACKVYVMADRYVVMWTPLGIMPVMRLQQRDQSYEMAIFASKPPRGGALVKQKITQPFRIYKGNRHGRVRNWAWKNTAPIGIYKNGVKVGECYTAQHSSGVRVTNTVDFNLGDEFELRMPAKPQGRNVTISIIGEYL